MKSTSLPIAILLLSLCGAAAAESAAPDIDALAAAEHSPARANADRIWQLAELGYQETGSADALAGHLSAAGFRVERGIGGIPTAFRATYGKGKPVVTLLAEYDALPRMSQAAEPQRRALAEDGAGHACGHHLFGAASTGAAVALARWLDAADRRGTVHLVGTPAEEGGSGKVYLARAGVFADADVVLHWHPSDRNDASPSATTANKSARFVFTGVAAHAANAPERGRSALDGVEAMNYMVNLMREHVPSDARIHYVISDGGAAPNIVPERASVYYYVRHPEVDTVQALFERVSRAARAAAMGTETSVDIEVMHGNYPVLPNVTLAERAHAHLGQVGGVAYTANESKFAQTLRETLPGTLPPMEASIEVQPFVVRQRMGSTDVGDVSWQAPTVGFSTATWVPGTPAHSWQAVAAGGMSIGAKGMERALTVLARLGVDVFTDDDLVSAAKAELAAARGDDFDYAPLLGDRDPPLDYRR